jgi:hypothetical protein
LLPLSMATWVGLMDFSNCGSNPSAALRFICTVGGYQNHIKWSIIVHRTYITAYYMWSYHRVSHGTDGYVGWRPRQGHLRLKWQFIHFKS